MGEWVGGEWVGSEWVRLCATCGLFAMVIAWCF